MPIALHPHRDLMLEAEQERVVVDSPEGQALLDAVFDAVQAYSNFLDRAGLIWEDGSLPRLKARALVVTVDYGKGDGIDVTLQDSACDRVYGNGRNPCPFGLGPPDIPHRPRDDE